MKFLADENFPRQAVETLRRAAFDVAWITEVQPGAADEEVLAHATAEGRTLLTFDKDFGELAFRRGLPAEHGIVLFRFIPQTPGEAATIIVTALGSQVTWAAHFSVVTRQRVRMTPLPRQK
jgi:predicted nuclease of predicted toxin-antitoxin system